VSPPGIRKAVAVALAVALPLVAACSSGGDDAKKSDKDKTETSSDSFTKAAVKLGVSKAELVSPHQALGPLDKGTTDAVVGIVQKLLLLTSAQPLSEGDATAKGLGELFTADAGARVTGPDRKAFFDEGLPRFGGLEPVASRVTLTALAASDNPGPALVVARYLWDVTNADRSSDRVTRTGELSLVKQDNQWKVAAYTIVVRRTVDGETTTTTATTETTR